MNRIDVFPQWMYEFEVERELLGQIVSELQKIKLQSRVTVLNDFPQFQFLRDQLNELLAEVHSDLKLICDRLEVSLFWVNHSKKGDWNEAHWHTNSWASGILYVTDSDSHTLFSRRSWWTEEKTVSIHEEREEFQPIKTCPGKAIVFPSHLVHSVSPHGLDSTRYAIAFNAFPAGNMGDSMLTQLNLSVG